MSAFEKKKKDKTFYVPLEKQPVTNTFTMVVKKDYYKTHGFLPDK